VVSTILNSYNAAYRKKVTVILGLALHPRANTPVAKLKKWKVRWELFYATPAFEQGTDLISTFHNLAIDNIKHTFTTLATQLADLLNNLSILSLSLASR
jgi:hypothetical protein